MGLYVFSLPISLMMTVRIRVLYHHQIGGMNHLHFLRSTHETMVCGECLFVFLSMDTITWWLAQTWLQAWASIITGAGSLVLMWCGVKCGTSWAQCAQSKLPSQKVLPPPVQGLVCANSGCGAKNVARFPHCWVSNATKSDPPVSHQDGIGELVSSGMKSTRIMRWGGHDTKAQHGWY